MELARAYCDLLFRSTQHCVGQGMMHSGIITSPWEWGTSRSLLATVYDCGTVTGNGTPPRRRIQREVNLLKSWVSTLHALYISHFDLDHVNGLPVLLTDFKPEAIVIPATTAAERLFRIVHTHGPDNLENLDSVTARIVADPASAIRDIVGDETEIVEMGPEDNAGPGSEPPRPLDDSLGWEPQVVKPSGNTHGAGAVWMKGRCVWEVRPWVQPSVQREVDEFLAALDVGSDSNLQSELQEWLGNIGKERKRIRDAYRQALGEDQGKGLNLTSLCLYSGPPRQLDFIANRCGMSTGYGRSYFLNRGAPGAPSFWHRSPAWIGTGDAPFGDDSYVSSFERAFNDVLHLAGQVTIPHHGSKKDTNDDFVDLFQPGTWWLASAGTNNIYNHPHPDTVKCIESKSGTVINVDEREESRLSSIDLMFFEC